MTPDRTGRTLLAAAVFVAALWIAALPAGAAYAPENAVPEEAGAARIGGPTVVAVGDVACAPADTSHPCRQAATAVLAASYAPSHVLALGDVQYEVGSLTAFQSSYDRSWGELKSITKPVPGNHEYKTSGASGYYSYFSNQQPGAPGYYAFNVGTWRVYALNSNCTEIRCRKQVRWLERDMRNHRGDCSAIMMHHPRFSSGGEHGSSTVSRRFWRVAYQRHADVALAGHDHDYERFARLDPSGDRANRGMVSFVSGAGGKSLYPFGPIAPGSLVRNNDAFGVLALTLDKGSFGYEYKTIDGRVVDSGVGECR